MIPPSKLNERGPAKEIRKKINEVNTYSKSLKISNGQGYTVKHTAIGQILNIKPGKDGVVSGAGMVFRGEWNLADDYVVNDVVVVRGGVSGGTFIAVLNVPRGTEAVDPPADPQAGI